MEVSLYSGVTANLDGHTQLCHAHSHTASSRPLLPSPGLLQLLLQYILPVSGLLGPYRVGLHFCNPHPRPSYAQYYDQSKSATKRQNNFTACINNHVQISL